MKYDEFLKQEKQIKQPKRHDAEEHRIQCACVRWFRLTHKPLAGLLYAVPNGGKRDKVSAAIMKREGVLAGVSDLNLDIPSGKYHGLRIEMKTPKGRQQASQQQFQYNVERQGYKYVICHSLDEFSSIINRYLNLS